MGVAVATMALVIVLSVFNGFHDLVASLFTAFDPQIEVVPAKGKDAPTDDPVLTQIKQLPEVDVATECVEDNALVFYGDKQAMVTIKGVDENFTQLTRINDLLYGEGEFALRADNLQYASDWPNSWEQAHDGMALCACLHPTARDNSTFPTPLRASLSTLCSRQAWCSR